MNLKNLFFFIELCFNCGLLGKKKRVSERKKRVILIRYMTNQKSQWNLNEEKKELSRNEAERNQTRPKNSITKKSSFFFLKWLKYVLKSCRASGSQFNSISLLSTCFGNQSKFSLSSFSYSPCLINNIIFRRRPLPQLALTTRLTVGNI
jgi:hypothetical protein